MTSMMIRKPRSYPEVVARIRDAVGAKRMAAECDVSESLVNAWADPDRKQIPNIRQAAILDGLMKTATGDMPITAEMIRRASATPPPPVGCIRSEFMDLPVALGALAETIAAAKASDGPGGDLVTPNELDAILKACRAVIDATRDVKQSAINEAAK